MLGVGMKDVPEDSVQGLSPLHGVLWCHLRGRRINTREHVVIDDARSAFSLWDAAQWRYAKWCEVSDETVGQYRKHALRSHVGDLRLDELGEGHCGRMIASLDGCILFVQGPW